jgi:hypothetical protein
LTLAAAPPQSPSDDSLGMDADVPVDAPLAATSELPTIALLTAKLPTAELLVVTSGADEVATPDVVEELLALQALTVQIVNAAARTTSLRHQISVSMRVNATRSWPVHVAVWEKML